MFLNALRLSKARNKASPYHRRNMSVIDRLLIKAPSSEQIKWDLKHAIAIVQKYDPVGYLPGLLIQTNNGKIGYFAVRAFWVQTGLRFQDQAAGIQHKGIPIDPKDRISFWKSCIESLFNERESENSPWRGNANSRLINYVMQQNHLSQHFFDRIIEARERDIDVKQYATIQSIVEHTEMSCGSLLHLTLQSAGVDQSDPTHVIYKTACEIGRAHGLTNALRTSIPVASTGKIIIPADLCSAYGVRSPRYLLSALGQGDEECRNHLKSAVKEIMSVARGHLHNARNMRKEVLDSKDGTLAVSAFLAAIGSETFLNRLENHQYDLTDKNLRQVGFVEHFICSSRLVAASIRKEY